MRSLSASVLAASALLWAPPAFAQSILGLDTGDGGITPPRIHDFFRDCNAQNICDSVSLSNPIADPAGGIAYGRCTGNVYTTDGFVLVATDASCNAICRVAVPLLTTSGWTGLDIDEEAGRIYFTDDVHVGYYDFRPCQIGNLGDFCRQPTGLNSPLTGVERDPGDGTLWVCDASGQVANLDLGTTSCRVRQIFRVACPGSARLLSLRGIALDPCNRVLYVTDDAGTVATVDLSGTVLSCCDYQRIRPARHFVGLARKPEGARSLGTGCTGPGCAACQPVAALQGEPVIPNRCFGFELRQAPLGGTAVLMLNVGGPCFQIPIGLCGPLEIGVPNFFGPGLVIGGGPGACNGQTALGLAIPPNFLLCGLPICAQWIMLCPGGGLGLSNGLSFSLN